MRELKLRAWHKKLKVMCQVTAIDFVKGWILVGDPTKKLLHFTWHDLSEFVLMQSIGRQDRNQNEIFDGDIVKDYKGRILQVAYANCYTRYMASYDGESCDYYLNEGITGDWKDRNTEYMTIIGNAYENPELLRSNKCDKKS